MLLSHPTYYSWGAPPLPPWDPRPWLLSLIHIFIGLYVNKLVFVWIPLLLLLVYSTYNKQDGILSVLLRLPASLYYQLRYIVSFVILPASLYFPSTYIMYSYIPSSIHEMNVSMK